MSLPLIILSLLTWLSLPALLAPSLGESRALLARRACRVVAALLMGAALLYQYL